MIGVYYLPLPTLCHEVNITARAARAALQALADVGFASYDETTASVWVPEMARYQIGPALQPRDKRITAILKMLAPFAAHPFAERFIAKYGEAFLLRAMPLQCPSEGPSEALGSQEQDQEQDQDHDQKAAPANDDGLTPEGLKDLWNKIIQRPAVEKMTATRVAHSKARIREHPDPAWWRSVFEKIPTTPFLRGESKNGWRATFDWIVANDTNGVKISEGQYFVTNSASQAGRVAPPVPRRTMADHRRDVDALIGEVTPK
ncbi:MAG TPA: hypothetical protein VJT33_03945 [bacterium]|nr:hypothetical protein [bacterium]